MRYGFAKPGPDDFGGTQRVGQCDVQTGLCIPAFGNDVVVRELHSAVRVEGLSRNEYVDDRGFGDDRHGYLTQLNVVVLAEGGTVERLTCECFGRKKQLPVCLPVPTVVAARRRVCAGFGRGVGEPNLRRGGSALDGVVNHIGIGAAPAVLRRVVVGARMDAARLVPRADDRAFAEPPPTWGRGQYWTQHRQRWVTYVWYKVRRAIVVRDVALQRFADRQSVAVGFGIREARILDARFVCTRCEWRLRGWW